MDDVLDIIELRFAGSEIGPDKVKPSEIGTLLASFEKALAETIKQNYPGIDTNSVLFSFKELKDESIGLHFKALKVKEVVLSSFFIISTSFLNNDFNKLNKATIQPLNSLVKFAKKYNCEGYFSHNGQVLSGIDKNTSIEVTKQYLAKGQTTLYGKLMDAGGEKPNIHLKISETETIIIPTSEKLAKELGARLFEKIGVKGMAEWNLLTDEITDFKIDTVLDYREGNISSAFQQLKSISSGFWDNFNTVDEISAELLRD